MRTKLIFDSNAHSSCFGEIIMRNYKFYDAHTHLAVPGMESNSLVSVVPEAPRPSGFRFAIGIHPWTLGEVNVEQQLELLASAAMEPDCAAIGECGLDRPDAVRIGGQLTRAARSDSFSDSNLESETKRRNGELGFNTQLSVFKRQIEIAEFAEKPIVIHCVRAFQELMTIKKESRNSIDWMIHGFRGSAEIAKSLVEQGVHISFGRSLLRREAPGWEKSAKALLSIPMDKLLLESDDTEPPHSDLREMYEIAAEIKKISIDDLCERVTENANRLFG